MVNGDNGVVLPMTGVVKDHIQDGNLVVCNLESLDIWINLFLHLKSADKTCKIFVKIRIDNHLSIYQVKNICQKLGLILWNKY